MGHYGLRELPSVRNAIELLLFGSEGTSRAQYHDMRYAYTRADGTEVVEDMLYNKRAVYFNNEAHGMHYGEICQLHRVFCSGAAVRAELLARFRRGSGDILCNGGGQTFSPNWSSRQDPPATGRNWITIRRMNRMLNNKLAHYDVQCDFVLGDYLTGAQ